MVAGIFWNVVSNLFLYLQKKKNHISRFVVPILSYTGRSFNLWQNWKDGMLRFPYLMTWNQWQPIRMNVSDSISDRFTCKYLITNTCAVGLHRLKCFNRFSRTLLQRYLRVFMWQQCILLTPWRWARLEKQPLVHLVKNFPTFYGTRRFTTVLPQYYPLIYVCLCLPIGLFPSGFPTTIVIY
jgi:hypothetical protein